MLISLELFLRPSILCAPQFWDSVYCRHAMNFALIFWTCYDVCLSIKTIPYPFLQFGKTVNSYSILLFFPYPKINLKVYIAFLLIPQKVNFYNFTLGYDSCNILYKKLTKLQFIYISLMYLGVIFWRLWACCVLSAATCPQSAGHARLRWLMIIYRTAVNL